MLPTLHLRIERWKFNKDHGVYVSTLGNFKDRYKRRIPIKIEQSGYCRVKTETNKRVLAHRLVMLTWRPIPNAEELTVDHLNHNKRDNSVYNLEWVTEEENKRRAAADYCKEESRKKIKRICRREACAKQFTTLRFDNHSFTLNCGGTLKSFSDPDTLFDYLFKHCPSLDLNLTKSIVKSINTLLDNNNKSEEKILVKGINKITIRLDKQKGMIIFAK